MNYEKDNCHLVLALRSGGRRPAGRDGNEGSTMSIEEMTLWVASKRSRWAKIEFDNDRHGDGGVQVTYLVGDMDLDVGQSIREIKDIDLLTRAVNRMEDMKRKLAANLELAVETRKA